jgi:hypothetical protein
MIYVHCTVFKKRNGLPCSSPFVDRPSESKLQDCLLAATAKPGFEAHECVRLVSKKKQVEWLYITPLDLRDIVHADYNSVHG